MPKEPANFHRKYYPVDIKKTRRKIDNKLNVTKNEKHCLLKWCRIK